MGLEVVATWRGGIATDVQARGHAIRVDGQHHATWAFTGITASHLGNGGRSSRVNDSPSSVRDINAGLFGPSSR